MMISCHMTDAQAVDLNTWQLTLFSIITWYLINSSWCLDLISRLETVYKKSDPALLSIFNVTTAAFYIMTFAQFVRDTLTLWGPYVINFSKMHKWKELIFHVSLQMSAFELVERRSAGNPKGQDEDRGKSCWCGPHANRQDCKLERSLFLTWP